MKAVESSLKTVTSDIIVFIVDILMHLLLDNQYAHLLSPTAAISPVGSSEIPTYDTIPDQEFETLLAELELDIRAADRDLREIDALDSKGVSAAGKLPGKHDVCVLKT